MYTAADVRQTLLALQERDLTVRNTLAAEKVLLGGYHPAMESVHRENAAQLREIIELFGWPNEDLAGCDGAEAAWLVAQHAISEPDFMRRCRELLSVQVELSKVPGWHLAYLHDRIQVFEGKLQRFGTQLELTPDGPVVFPVEDLERVDQRRELVGLGPIKSRLDLAARDARPTPLEFMARKESELKWKLTVGWLVAAAT